MQPPALDPTHVFGREPERQQIDAAWAAGAGWISLVGPPGAGKTHLARALGGCVVDLIGARTAIEVIERLAAALGVSLGGMAADVGYARLTTAVADQTLVVLDNLEQIEPGFADVLAPLRVGRSTRWLGTSRRPLGIEGEVCIFVEGLPLAPAGALFRARAWSAGSPVTASPAVATIVRRLDGLPLALELAAARVPVLGLAGLATALDTSLAHLRDPTRGRHAGLDTALAASWILLSPAQRTDLAALTVCEGALTPALAAALWETDAADGLARLDALRAGCWLRRTAADAALYRLYVGVRAFVRKQQPTTAAPRLADWLARRAEALWHAQFSDSPARVLGAIATHGPDLRAALRGSSSQAAGWAALALHTLTTARGPWRPRTVDLDAALAFDLAPDLRALVLGTRGLDRGLRGEYVEANADLDAALALAQAAARPDRVAWVLGGLSPVRRFAGRLHEAEALAREELRLAEVYDLPREYARALFNLAGALALLAPADTYPASADRMWRQARRAGFAIGDRRLAAVCLANLGVIAVRAGRLAIAEGHLATTITELAELEMPEMLAKIWVDRVQLALARDDLVAARVRIAEARTEAARLHDLELQVDMVIAAARLAERVEPAQAADAWVEARLFAAALGQPGLVERVQRARPCAGMTSDGFVTDAGEMVVLTGHPVLKRVLTALAKSPCPLSVPALVEAAWPDERILPEAAANRVYTAVRALRRFGAPIKTVPGVGYSAAFSQRSSVPSST